LFSLIFYLASVLLFLFFSLFISRVERITAARAVGEPTVPSALSEELATNPFLRADQPAIAANLNLTGAEPVEVFTKIRAQKDAF